MNLVRALELLRVTFDPRFELTAERVRLWEAALCDLDPVAVNTAVIEYIRSGGEHPPVPSTIRRLASPERPGPTGGELWDEAMEAIRFDREGGVSEGCLAAVRSVGGWGVLQGQTHETRTSNRARFLEAVRDLGARRAGEEAYQRAVEGSRAVPLELSEGLFELDGG